MPTPVTPRRVLAIRLSSLGDTLLTFPALDALKAAHPSAHVTFVTSSRFGSLPHGCPSVDEVIAIDQPGLRRLRRSAFSTLGSLLRRATTGEFDCALDFHGYPETAALAFATAAPVRLGRPLKTLSFWYTFTPDGERPRIWYQRHVDLLRGAGVIPPDAPTPPVRVVPDAAAHDEAAAWISEAGVPTAGGDVLAIFPGASHSSKTWPAHHFSELANVAASRGRIKGLVIFTGPREIELAEQIRQQVHGCPVWVTPSFLPLPFVAAVQQIAPAAFVANDTGPMHLAVASQACRVVVLYDFRRVGFEHPPPHITLIARDATIANLSVLQVLASLGWS